MVEDRACQRGVAEEETRPSFTALPPLALYIHIPWCIRRCPYCDFNSYPQRSPIPEADYVRALICDLEQELPWVQGRRIGSIFLGGGTPSLCSPKTIARLISEIKRRVDLTPCCEITLEANPGTIEAQQCDAFHDAGVNRLSLGVQSFHDPLLSRIGRIHTARDALRAVEAAVVAGYRSVNIDLMFGLPGQSVRAAIADIETAIALGVDHISHYQLTIEPNTPFYRHPPALPTEHVLECMQREAGCRLNKAQFYHYETSAYARRNQFCNHNMNYWRFGDYIGLGAGAHGKVTDLDRQVLMRTVKQPYPKRYLKAADSGQLIKTLRQPSMREIPLEFMMNTLRLSDGFSWALFSKATGLSPELIAEPIRQALGRGLLALTKEGVRPTALGRRFLNELLMHFVPTTTSA